MVKIVETSLIPEVEKIPDACEWYAGEMEGVLGKLEVEALKENEPEVEALKEHVIEEEG